MSRYRRKRKSKLKGIFFIILLIAIVAGGVFVFSSGKFEKVAPNIEMSDKIYSNLKEPIKIKITDNVAVKKVDVYALLDGKKVPISSQSFPLEKATQIASVIVPPKFKNSNKLIIEAFDSSKWNFFRGNKSIKEVTFIADSKPPKIDILASSNSIMKGGSALVIFTVSDYGLKKLYIETKDGNKFKVAKYRKNGVFASLIAWKFNIDSFTPVIVAEDLAGNVAKVTLDISRLDKKYRISKIRASDRFINGKISDLASLDSDYSNLKKPLEKFKAVNEYMRKKNEDYIHTNSKKVTAVDENWNIQPFYSIKKAKRVANYGDHRYYYYKTPDNIISESYHVGLDLASIKHDKIYASNSGVVVSTSRNGIYGNMPLIDHGLGLYTLYGHCSKVSSKVGDKVNAGDIIARTGVTGLALGDHVHFGILVQGVEVNPYEWMDKKWIKNHISDIFAKANKKLGYN